jgi:hypothetical protein
MKLNVFSQKLNVFCADRLADEVLTAVSRAKAKGLVANRPRFMEDLILGTIRDQPDIEIVGESEDEGEITEMVERIASGLPDFRS